MQGDGLFDAFDHVFVMIPEVPHIVAEQAVSVDTYVQAGQAGALQDDVVVAGALPIQGDGLFDAFDHVLVTVPEVPHVVAEQAVSVDTYVQAGQAGALQDDVVVAGVDSVQGDGLSDAFDHVFVMIPEVPHVVAEQAVFVDTYVQAGQAGALQDDAVDTGALPIQGDGLSDAFDHVFVMIPEVPHIVAEQAVSVDT
jgi:hypothetical protein